MIVHTGEAFRLAPDTGFSFQTQAPDYLSSDCNDVMIMMSVDFELDNRENSSNDGTWITLLMQIHPMVGRGSHE
ncbi:hypothetical protein SDJN03_03932, partial [Cucurbita argyrosperma subsp. sororia]